LSLLCSFICQQFFPRSPFLVLYTPKSTHILEVLHLHLHCTRSELQPVSSSSLMPVVSLVKIGPPFLKLQWGSGDTDPSPLSPTHATFIFCLWRKLCTNFSMWQVFNICNCHEMTKKDVILASQLIYMGLYFILIIFILLLWYILPALCVMSRYHSCFIFRKSQFQISAQKPVIMTEVILGLP